MKVNHLYRPRYLMNIYIFLDGDSIMGVHTLQVFFFSLQVCKIRPVDQKIKEAEERWLTSGRMWRRMWLKVAFTQFKINHILLNDRKGRSTNLFVNEKGEIGSNLRQGPYNAVINHEVIYLTEGKLKYIYFIFLYHTLLFFSGFFPT